MNNLRVFRENPAVTRDYVTAIAEKLQRESVICAFRNVNDNTHRDPLELVLEHSRER